MREGIDGRYATNINLCLIAGGSMIVGLPMAVTQDDWLSVAISILPMLLLMLLYRRLCVLMPGMDLFSMAEAAMGKAAGRVASALFALYALFLAGLATSYMTTFVNLTSLFKTPFTLIALILTLPVLYIAKCGTRMLGRWAVFLSFFLYAVLAITWVLSLRLMEPRNVMPILGSGLKSTVTQAFSYIGLPYGEGIVLLMLLGPGARGKNRPHLALSGLLAAVLIGFSVFRIIATLGPYFTRTTYFAYYKAASVIRVSKFLQRIESLLGLMYLLMGIFKASACSLAASRGAAASLGKPGDKEGRALVLPMVLLALGLSGGLFANNYQTLNFQNRYWWFALPIQVGIPAAMWVCAEVRAHKRRRKDDMGVGEAG